jgi:AhpD family alkylhydroperoxidase
MRAIYLDKAFPDLYSGLRAVSKQASLAALGTGLSPLLVELIKLRASQLNGCAYCLRMHTRIALGQGETTDRLAVLQNWRETEYFTDQERAALALTEELTLIGDVTAGRRAAVADHAPLTDEQVAAVRWVGLLINAFNRLSITSEHPVEPEEARAAAVAPIPSALVAPAAPLLEAAVGAQAPPVSAPPAPVASAPVAPPSEPTSSESSPGVVEELSEFMHGDERDSQ